MTITDLLTEMRIRRAKPRTHPYKLRDGGGLYLLVNANDAKQWRLRYRLGGRESMAKAVWTLEDLLFDYLDSLRAGGDVVPFRRPA